MWLSHVNYPSAWVAISESTGQKPSEFYERFALALLSLQPDNAALKTLLEQKSLVSFSFVEQALKVFTLHAIKPKKQKMTVVIDDLHFMSNAEINKNLPELIKLLPENITIFILSRCEPPKNFCEFVVKDIVATVDADNLKFSENEIQSLFASRNRTLTAQQSQNILKATGGWAIGLNAVLLSDNQQYSGKRLSRYLEEYMKEEVWGRWDKERQDFILRVSVADELSPDFCNAMTGRNDSANILDALVSDNAFISVDKNENVYRFHNLFQDFLTNLPEHKSMKKKLYNAAGDWFYDHADYYKAVEYYMKCGNKDGIVKSITLMYDYNSPYASVEDTVAIIRMSVNDSVINEYPFLLETLAWADFVEGRGKEMEENIDRYFKQLPKIILQNPVSALTFILLRCMDYRYNMVDILHSFKGMPFKKFARANTPSITQNMPFFHRSTRDYSEFLADEENSFDVLKNTWGLLLKKEYDIVEKCLCCGFMYERGNMEAAYDFALSAVSDIKENFTPEFQFCALMILAAVLDAQNRRDDAKEALDRCADMIEQHKAYYLYGNLQAYICRRKLYNSDTNAAKDWLKYNADPIGNNLQFYKQYQHFTTARAYIVMGDCNHAILLLKKILSLSEQYRRPLDIIEANILLAIAYLKNGRSRHAAALEYLEQAVALAYKYRYTQLFTNEGADIVSMLHKLQKRAVQAENSQGIPADFIKTLYISAVTASKISKGLTGGKTSENPTFTEKQKTVMVLMCKGFSRKEIAEKMSLKPYGVKSHIELIYKKLDVFSSIDAITKINEMGLLKE